MFGFGWGVAGAALATSFSQYCSLGILLAMGIRKGMLKFSDLRYPPDPRDIGALLRVRHIFVIAPHIGAPLIGIKFLLYEISVCAGLARAQLQGTGFTHILFAVEVQTGWVYTAVCWTDAKAQIA